MYCTECGQKNEETTDYCMACGKPLDKDEIVSNKTKKAGPSNVFQVQANNSGQGKLSAMPPELTGWNWGAFFLTWIWGIGNNTFIALLCFIPFVNFIMIFILGAKGNEWAWQNKKWMSIEHFKKVQRLWAIWGLILFLAGILFFILMIIIISSIDPYY